MASAALHAKDVGNKFFKEGNLAECVISMKPYLSTQQCTTCVFQVSEVLQRGRGILLLLTKSYVLTFH